jgi:hypothetical protein
VIGWGPLADMDQWEGATWHPAAELAQSDAATWHTLSLLLFYICFVLCTQFVPKTTIALSCTQSYLDQISALD